MIASELRKRIAAHRGKLIAPVMTPNGCIHVNIEKRDLLDILRGYGTEECGLHMYEMDDGTMCVGADHL